jgi:hypothetical protein
MPLEALIGVVQEFLGGITALFCGAPHHSYAVLDCISYHMGCAGSLAS